MSSAGNLLAFKIQPRTAVDPFSAIGGTSILGDFRSAAEEKFELSYFQFAGFIELAEALVFHDRVVLLGRPEDDEDTRYIDRINDACGSYVINTIAEEDELTRFVDTSPVQERLREVLDACFGRGVIAASPRTLSRRPAPSRATDDYKRELIDTFRASALASEPSSARLDVDGFAAFLRAELFDSYHRTHKQFTINYLFRAFLHAAIALENNGTLLADGTRRIVRSLIIAKCPAPPVTLAKRLYDLANAAYRITAWPQGAAYPYIPIAIQYVLKRSTARTDILKQVAALRRMMEPYRSTMNEHHALLTSIDAPPRELARARATLVAASEKYITELMSTFGLSPSSKSGVLSKFAAKTIDSLAGVPKFKTGAESELETEVTGQLLLQLIRVGYGTYADKREEKRIAPILELVDDVASSRGVIKAVSALLPVLPFDWQPFDESAYRAYTAV